MNQKGSFNYYTSEDLQAHVVELPYVGDHVSMVSHLNQQVEGLPGHVVELPYVEDHVSMVGQLIQNVGGPPGLRGRASLRWRPRLHGMSAYPTGWRASRPTWSSFPTLETTSPW